MGPAEGRYTPYRIPCGQCLSCRLSQSRDWAYRAWTELWDHKSVAFATLTYDPKFVPPTLVIDDVQRFLKRVRLAHPVRYFGCGEYGTQRGRPHFHLILYGADPESRALRQLLADSWREPSVRFVGGGEKLGFVDVDRVTPRVISYVAGYVSEKLVNYSRRAPAREVVDTRTGELLVWRPEFRLSSRRPGLGASARAFPERFRSEVVLGGVKFPPPRYLHQAWVKAASEEDRAALEEERRSRFRIRSAAELDALRHDAFARLAITKARRQRL